MSGRTVRPVLRLVQSTDFQRVLRAPQRSRSEHFAVHYLADQPAPARRAVVPELSTGEAPSEGKAVDELATHAPLGLWIGAVLPKRHARRSVTRSLLKRQIYAAAERHAGHLPHGLWIVRLRRPFDTVSFPSAASGALRAAARAELDGVFARALH